jgi:uronate dehydrogenase
MKRVLLTGASGGIATAIRPILRRRYALRLSSQDPVKDVTPDEDYIEAQLSDFAAVRRAVAGVDAIIHLGGFAFETDWETIHQSNIVGVYNVFEAARLEGVRRIVFASSGHAVGFYPRSQTIPPDVTPKPDSRYGLSKAFGEAVGSLYAEKYGAEVMSIRIGHMLPRPHDRRRLAIWISPRDLAQLIGIGLDLPNLRHEIVYGISDNKRAWWDNSRAHALGYRPQDRSEDYAAEAIAGDRDATGDPKADLNQGAEFCILESM